MSCVSSHSSMLNIFAVFWNTGINWMIAYKMGWVVGFIYMYIYIFILYIYIYSYLHSQPQQPLSHNTQVETVNEQQFCSFRSHHRKDDMYCLFFFQLHPASFPLVDGLRWINTAPQALWEKIHKAGLQFNIENMLEITKHLCEMSAEKTSPLFSIFNQCWSFCRHALWMVPPLTVAHNAALNDDAN